MVSRAAIERAVKRGPFAGWSGLAWWRGMRLTPVAVDALARYSDDEVDALAVRLRAVTRRD